jgi:protein-disulfide isomerase
MSKSSKQPAKTTRRQAVAALRASRQRRSWSSALAVAAVVLFAAAVGVGIYFAQRPTQVVVPPNATAQSVVVGQPGAAVTIDLYEDFQCPACRQFEQQVGPTVQELIDTGTVKVAYHPVAYLDRFSSTRYSTRASAASGCAAAAGVFPRFHELLFANQPPEGGDGLPADRIVALGQQAGASGEDFAACVRDERYAGWTANLTDAASKAGVNATPTVQVNGKPLPQPSAQALREAVERVG